MKLLSFGEFLWDIVDSKEYIGGAAYNLAAHATIFGADCALVSAIGHDERGQKAISIAKEMGIDCQFIQINEDYPTGIVEASISEKGQPEYTIHEPVAYDFIDINDDGIAEILERKFDVFCFGILAARNIVSRDSLKSLISALSESGVKIFCDINLRQHFYDKDILKFALESCHTLKVNDEEVAVISKMFEIDASLSVEEFCKKLAQQMNIKEIIVTMGAKGAIVFDGNDFCYVDGENIEVVNTIGAGDCFSAVFLAKRFEGASLKQATYLANKVASFVCTQNGAVPIIPQTYLVGESHA